MARKINIRPFPLAIQWSWLATLKAKEVPGTTTSEAPVPSQPMKTTAAQSSTSPVTPEHTKYCAICTPLGKIYPNKFPMSSGWDKDNEKERKDQNEGENHRDSKGKTPQSSPRFISTTTFTPQPFPNPPLNSSARGPA